MVSMSSILSSECDCAECRRYCYGPEDTYYGSSFQGGRPPVFSIRPPLVYYAQVQHQAMATRESKEHRKVNRNFFTKAFKWYTQERAPALRKVTPDISGFATWLDAKYGEYLQDNNTIQPTQSQLQLNQMPTLESIDKRDLCDECANKKDARASPWRQSKRASNEAGDVIDKTHQSFEFIMRPKDSTKAAPECYHTTPTSFQTKSTANLVSSDTESANKTRTKSQSVTCACQRKGNLSNKTSVQDEERAVEKMITIIMPKATEMKIIETPINIPQIQADEISCQFPENKVVNLDKQTQYYEDLKTEPDNKSRSTDQIKLVPVQAKAKKQSKAEVKISAGHAKDVVTQKNIENSKDATKTVDIPDGICEYKQETMFMKNVTYTRTRPIPILISDDAQTSDHSIDLKKEIIHGYPLFMKIVRADKLN